MANFCSNCGNKVDENAYVCVKCGVVVGENKNNNVSASVDNGGFGYGILGFFFPLIGLILYLCWKKEKPNTAKSIGIGALVNVSLTIFVPIIIFILYHALVESI